MKKNKILVLFNSISDEDLISAVNEIREDKLSGVIRSEGFVRAYASKFVSILDDGLSGKSSISPTVLLDRVEILLLTEAAYRWADKN